MAVLGYCGYPQMMTGAKVQNSVVKPAAPVAEVIQLEPVTAFDKELDFLAKSKTAQPQLWSDIWQQYAFDSEHRLMLAQTWMELNPKAFLQCLLDHYFPLDTSSYEARNLLFRSWARRDPEAAFQAARSVTDLPGFSGAPREVAEELMSKDLLVAIKYIKQLPTNFYSWDVPPAAYQKDPGLFLELFLPLESGSSSWTASMDAAIEHWVLHDMKSLPVWLAKHPSLKERILPKVIQQLAKAEPAEVAATISQMEVGKLRENYAKQYLLPAWSAKDPAAAVAWCQENLFAERHRTICDIFSKIAEQDPQKASQMVTQLPSGSTADEVIRSIALRWADKDALATVKWLKSLPKDDARAAYKHIAAEWVEADVASAKDFVLHEPDGPWLIGAELVSKLATSDPNEAAKCIAALPKDAHYLALDLARTVAESSGAATAMKYYRAFADAELNEEIIESVMSAYRYKKRPLAEGLAWVKSLNDRAQIKAAREQLIEADFTEAEHALIDKALPDTQ
jgi:hypothetical protein